MLSLSPGIISLVLTRCTQWASERFSRMIPSSLLAWRPPQHYPAWLWSCLPPGSSLEAFPWSWIWLHLPQLPNGVLLSNTPQAGPTMLMPPPTQVTEPTPWVPSCVNVDSDLEHDLGGGLGSLSPGASHSPRLLSSPSLQFRNELSSLTVQALGLVWSNECSHCGANLLLILRCNPASSKRNLGLSPSSCREHNRSPCDLV